MEKVKVYECAECKFVHLERPGSETYEGGWLVSRKVYCVICGAKEDKIQEKFVEQVEIKMLKEKYRRINKKRRQRRKKAHRIIFLPK